MYSAGINPCGSGCLNLSNIVFAGFRLVLDRPKPFMTILL